jgi:hypothetical protein
METGRREESAGKAIPVWFIQKVSASHNGRPVLTAQWRPSIARNPFLQFVVKGAWVQGPGWRPGYRPTHAARKWPCRWPLPRSRAFPTRQAGIFLPRRANGLALRQGPRASQQAHPPAGPARAITRDAGGPGGHRLPRCHAHGAALTFKVTLRWLTFGRQRPARARCCASVRQSPLHAEGPAVLGRLARRTAPTAPA